MAFRIQGEFNLKGNAKAALQSIGTALRGVKKESDAVGSTLKSTNDTVLKTESALDKARASALKAGAAADSLAGSYINAAGKLVSAKGKFIKVSEAADTTSQKTEKAGLVGQKAGGLLARAAQVAGNAWQRTAGLLGSAKDKIAGAFNLPNTIAAGLTGGAVGLTGKSIIDAVGFKEQTNNSLDTMLKLEYGLKSSEMALKTYKWALKTASATPFETTDVLDTTKQLLANRFTLKEIPTMFNTIGDSVSSLFSSAESNEGMSRIVRAFGQIRGAGKATTEDLNQLRDAGIPVFDTLAKAYSMTGGEFRKALEQGKIGSEDTIGILLDFMKKNYGGGMDKQSKSIFGLVSSLKSRPFELFQSLDADKELLPVKNVLNNLITLTDFDNNPVGRKIRSRFTSSMNSLFGGVFGSLAKTTNPEQIGKTLDKVFDRIDKTMAWFNKEGPGILAGAKSFFAGVGSAIDTVRKPLEWLNGITKGGLLQGLGALAVGGIALKGFDTLTGGLAGKAAGGLLGGGVQKVFVVNMGAGGLPDVGGLGGGLWQRTKTMFGKVGGWFTRVGAGGVSLLARATSGLGAVKTRIGAGLGSLAARGGTALMSMTGTLVTRVGILGSTIGSSLLTIGSGVALRFTTLLGTIGTGLAGLGTTLSTGLTGLSGSILGKLGMAAAAFGVGWAAGTAISKISTGKNADGSNRTVGSEVQDTLGNMFFNRDAQQGQLIKDQADIARIKAQIARNRAAGRNNGAAYGQGLQQGINNTRGAASAAGSALGNAANTGTRNTLQVKSPSRVSMGFGKMFGTGLRIGIDNTKNQVGSAAVGLGAVANAGTRGALQLQNPFGLGYGIALDYGDGLLAGLRQQLTPIQVAAKTLAAAVAVSGMPSFATANPSTRDPLSAANLPPIGAVSAPARATNTTPTISITFGDIIVQGGSNPQAVGAAVANEIETQLLEALERVAAKIGGIG